MPKTDDKCTTAGIYESTCPCHRRETMPLGHQFPPCKIHGDVNYVLIQATKTA